MSVLIVTSVGDIEVDLYTERCPLACKNFLKLCKIKYYNGCLFHTVEKDFLAQTGDPTGTGTGGDSIFKFLYGDQARFFDDEIRPDLRHTKTGTVAMASAGKNCNASQFYITLRDGLDYLDDKHTVFGTVAVGLETLQKINEAYADAKGRPFKDIRIKHTYILDDPFDDPPQLAELIPENSPLGKPRDETAEERLEDSWVPLDEKLAPEEVEEMIRSKEAHTNAAILESIGDIPDVDIKPPDNVLFVCKLNPVTEDEDLSTIFSRFGKVTSAEIIRDYKTGDSLCYAFIEFETKEACERAYFKMDNCLIDDRRIHVDFSQSVSRLWGQYRQNKRNASKDGCFKCGAPDHLARDCDQGGEGKNKGPSYVLKDDNTQRGGNNRRSYDLVFDEDHAGYADQQERGKGHRTKMRKVDHRTSEQPVGASRDENGQDKADKHDKGSRHGKEDDRSRGSRMREDSRSHKQSGHQTSERYGDREYSKHHDSGRSKDGEEHHRSSSGGSRRGKDRYDGDERRLRDEGGHRKKSHDTDRYRADDNRRHERSRHPDDRSYRERRDRDGR